MNKISEDQLDKGVVLIDGYHTFTKYAGLKDWINSKLGTDFRAVFCTSKLTLKKDGLDFSGDQIMLVKHDLSYILIGNSEWGWIRS